MTGILGGEWVDPRSRYNSFKKKHFVELQTHHCQFHCTSLIMTPAIFLALGKHLENTNSDACYTGRDRASEKKNVSKLKK